MSEISLDTAAQNIYNRLAASPTYHPANASLFTDWNLQAGDVVTVAADNESYSVPIYNMKLKWVGQAKVDIESTGNPEREQPKAADRKAYRSAAGGYGGQKATNDVLHDAGLFVDPVTGVWAYASEQGADYALGATFAVQAGQISSKVSNGEISSTINQTPQAVLIQASKINLSGYVTVDDLAATNASITNLTTGVTQASILSAVSLIGTRLTVTGNSMELGGTSATWQSASWPSGSGLTNAQYIGYSALSLAHYHAITVEESGGVVTITQGAAQSSAGVGTFNIAATQFYQDAVAAAYAQGVLDGSGTIEVDALSCEITASSPYWNSNNVLMQDIRVAALHDEGGGEYSTLLSQTFTRSAMAAYNLGVADVTIASVTPGSESLSGNVYTVPVTATATNNETGSANVTVDASARYTAGQNSIKMEKTWGTGSDANKATISRTTSSSGTINDITVTVAATAGISYNSSAHTYTASAQAKGDGTVRASDTATSGTEAYTAGQNSVTINKGGWDQGNKKVEFTKSAGTASTKSVVLSGRVGSYDSTNKKYVVSVYDDGTRWTGLDVDVDATDAFNAGKARFWRAGSRQWGYTNNGGATWNMYYQGTMFRSYDEP